MLLPFVRAYHEFEGIETTDSQRAESIAPLLHDSRLGQIWLIEARDHPVGYIALCFGYSIEFGGRDAFVDEFYLVEAARSQGMGSAVLETVKDELVKLGVRAIHLEVARTNLRAKRFYSRAGFDSRERFHLMSCYLDRQ